MSQRKSQRHYYHYSSLSSSDIERLEASLSLVQKLPHRTIKSCSHWAPSTDNILIASLSPLLPSPFTHIHTSRAFVWCQSSFVCSSPNLKCKPSSSYQGSDPIFNVVNIIARLRCILSPPFSSFVEKKISKYNQKSA